MAEIASTASTAAVLKAWWRPAHRAVGLGVWLVASAWFAPLSHGQAASLDDLTIYTEFFPPFNYADDQGKLEGISVDLLETLLARAGSSLTREDMALVPWARGYREVQDKPNTLLFSMARTPAREELFQWIGPISDIKYSIIALKSSNLAIQTPEDLQGIRFGAIRDDIGMTLLESNGIPRDTQQLVARNEQNIEKLVRGRIDAWVYDEAVAIWLLRQTQYPLDQFEIVYNLSVTPLYIAAQKETPPQVVETLQQALDDLRQTGEFEGIINSHSGL
ncbi:MAG: substrate-binding periplasmic protein [Candidatus Competibacterales bacterium]